MGKTISQRRLGLNERRRAFLPAPGRQGLGAVDRVSAAEQHSRHATGQHHAHENRGAAVRRPPHLLRGSEQKQLRHLRARTQVKGWLGSPQKFTDFSVDRCSNLIVCVTNEGDIELHRVKTLLSYDFL